MTKEKMALNILLVEDNVGDARLLTEVLREINKTVRIYVATDGVEAMAFLRYQGPYLHVPRPDIILLDLNLPLKNGLAVLAEVKSDNWLRTIPIIVLTTSQSEADVQQSYHLLASGYLVKLPELNEFERIVKSLNDYWLTSVRLQKQMQASPEKP